MTVTTELVGFIILVLGFVTGAWVRIEAIVTRARTESLAAAQLAAEVPEPGMAAMFATLGGLMFAVRRRSPAKKA